MKITTVTCVILFQLFHFNCDNVFDDQFLNSPWIEVSSWLKIDENFIYIVEKINEKAILFHKLDCSSRGI